MFIEKIDVSDIKNIRDFEKALRQAGVSRKDAVALASKKIETQRDAETDEKASYRDTWLSRFFHEAAMLQSKS